MADPHNQSVLSLRIERFRDDMFSDLSDQETYCYDQSTDAPLEDFQPKFQELSNAFESWMDNDRNTEYRDFIHGLYAFLSLNSARNLGEDALYNDSDAYKIFNAGGLVNTILTEDETYFDDVVCYEDDGSGNLVQVQCDKDKEQTREFPTLDDAISTVNGASELSELESLKSSYINIISTNIHIDLFEDREFEGTPLGKDDLRIKIFEELNHLPIYQEFNIGLPLPSQYEE